MGQSALKYDIMARPRKDVNKALAIIAQDLIESGNDISDIGVIVGALGTDSLKWLEGLKKECTDIDEFLKIAKTRADIALIAAAVQAAMGYDYEEVDQTYLKIPKGMGADGRPLFEECEGNKKVKKKHARKNDALLKFILQCRMPEYFQDVKKVEINKKTIEIKEVAEKEIMDFAGKLLKEFDSKEADFEPQPPGDNSR